MLHATTIVPCALPFQLVTRLFSVIIQFALSISDVLYILVLNSGSNTKPKKGAALGVITLGYFSVIGYRRPVLKTINNRGPQSRSAHHANRQT